MIESGYLQYLIVFLTENNKEYLLYDTEEEKKEIEELLRKKADQAATLFEESSRNGSYPGEALEAAHEYLKSGWGLSKYHLLNDILTESDPRMMDQLETKGKKDKFILSLIHACSAIFDKYDLNSADFVSTDSYELLLSSLRKTLTKFLNDLKK